jgi:hypothetical protein
MELRDICKACPEHCCLGPVLSIKELHNIRDAIGEESHRNAQPYWTGKYWKYKSRLCPAFSETGCILPYDKKPRACQLAPFLPVPVMHGAKETVILVLNIKGCPMWREWGEHYDEACQEVINGKR